MMSVVFIGGLLSVGLMRLGIRGLAALGTRRGGAIVLVLLFLSGCGGSNKPEAIWCETGADRGRWFTRAGSRIRRRTIRFSNNDSAFHARLPVKQ